MAEETEFDASKPFIEVEIMGDEDGVKIKITVANGETLEEVFEVFEKTLRLVVSELKPNEHENNYIN